jgi:hypothetical protein
MRTTANCENCGKPVDLTEAKHIHKVIGWWEMDKKGRPIKLKKRVEGVAAAYHWWCWRDHMGGGEQSSLF